MCSNLVLFLILQTYNIIHWLVKYATFIENLIEKQNKKLNLEIVAYLINFIGEIEDFLFKQHFPDLEAERINNLENPNKHVYDELIFKTMEGQDKAFHEACTFVECRFGFTMSDFKTFLEKANSNGSAEWREMSSKCKLPYSKEDLPIVDRIYLKQAYLEYANGIKLNASAISRLITFAQSSENYKEIAMMNIYNIKYRHRDFLKKKNKFDERYFDCLIENDDVLKKDPEIIDMQESLQILKSEKTS